MLKSINRLMKDKRGNVLIITGACLPLLVGSAGLATDTIQWVTWKRQLQRAADSAAFAGVYAKMQDASISTAVSNDVTHNNKTGIALLSTPEISYPADTSSYRFAVKVKLQVQKQLSFSSLFLSQAPVISAEGTAAVVPTGEYCVVSLESTSATGITATGSTSVDLGCGMITNSTSLDAAVSKGSSYVNASPIAAVGGIDTTGNWANGTDFLPFTIAQQDPFASVDANPPSTCNGGKLSVNPSSSKLVTQDADPANNCFTGMDLKGDVEFEPGTYYISGGDFNVNSGAKVIAKDGVTFILTNISNSSTATIGTVTINGGATVEIEAPNSGDYAGIAFYQDRRAVDDSSSSASSPNKINGNSSSSYEGAFYFPKQQMTFNGTAGMKTSCVQMVARRVYFSGNADISNTCDDDGGAHSFEGQHVRLVG